MKTLVRITSSPNWVAEEFNFGVLTDGIITPIRMDQAVKKMGYPMLVAEWDEARFSADDIDAGYEAVDVKAVPKWAQPKVREILAAPTTASDPIF